MSHDDSFKIIITYFFEEDSNRVETQCRVEALCKAARKKIEMYELDMHPDRSATSAEQTHDI